MLLHDCITMTYVNTKQKRLHKMLIECRHVGFIVVTHCVVRHEETHEMSSSRTRPSMMSSNRDNGRIGRKTQRIVHEEVDAQLKGSMPQCMFIQSCHEEYPLPLTPRDGRSSSGPSNAIVPQAISSLERPIRAYCFDPRP